MALAAYKFMAAAHIVAYVRQLYATEAAKLWSSRPLSKQVKKINIQIVSNLQNFCPKREIFLNKYVILI